VHAAPHLVAGAVAALADEHGCRSVVDVGAGRGELLGALAALRPDLDTRGVDVVDRPVGVHPRVKWSATDPATMGLPDVVRSGLGEPALVVAWELLDVEPCPVLEVDDDAVPRTVEVDAAGRERLGEPAADEDLAWCARWWPLDGAEPGDRVEVGAPRDRRWAALAASLPSGLLLAVDYAHTRAHRPATGTLSGFRGGRAVPPVPDGLTDITAHVALDAVGDAATAAGAGAPVLERQDAALARLGLRRGSDPAAAELLDPGGLGGFWWLTQTVRAG
jgi:SAM-dependent MidA family methyltransferase